MSELLEIRDLSIALPPGADRPLAVENLSLRVRRGSISHSCSVLHQEALRTWCW